jgi:HEAT repeat protein
MDHWKNTIKKYYNLEIDRDQFDRLFPADLLANQSFALSMIDAALVSKDQEELDLAIWFLLFFHKDKPESIDVLNELLVNPDHKMHQVITKRLQDLKSPSSIPYIRQVLEGGFDFLAYTGSESRAIAKWFSHALASIGTPEAIQLIEQFSHSEDEGVRDEMRYRLKKIT